MSHQKYFWLFYNSLNISQQSGRSEMMTLEMAEGLEDFLAKYTETKMLNLSETNFVSTSDFDTILCQLGKAFKPKYSISYCYIY